MYVQNRIEVPGRPPPSSSGIRRQHAQDVAGVGGLRRAALLRPTKSGQPYVATMEFDSPEDFMAWMRSDSFRAAHANAKAPGEHAPPAESFTVVETSDPERGV